MNGRRFDHDEARRQRVEDGLTYREIAAHHGVSEQRVWDICALVRKRTPHKGAPDVPAPERLAELRR